MVCTCTEEEKDRREQKHIFLAFKDLQRPATGDKRKEGSTRVKHCSKTFRAVKNRKGLQAANMLHIRFMNLEAKKEGLSKSALPRSPQNIRECVPKEDESSQV